MVAGYKFVNKSVVFLLGCVLTVAVNSLLANELRPVSISGVVEIEASSSENYTGVDSSDIVLATVELGVDAEVAENVSAHILLLFEEDDSPLEVDEGTISISSLGGTPLNLTAGRMYVPFGNFESNMVSDPLTLELAETQESVVQLGFDINGFYGSAYIFNGDSKDSGDEDKAKQSGLNLGYVWESEALFFDAGLSYLSSLADSDSMQSTVTTVATLADTVSGLGAHGIVSSGAFTVIGEYVTALDKFNAVDFAFNGRDAKPGAYNLEVAYGLEMASREATIAVAVQATDEALTLGLPERRALLALNIAVYDNTNIALEWARDEDYSVRDGGTGMKADKLIAQLAVEF